MIRSGEISCVLGPRPSPGGTDLPVLLPAAAIVARRASEERVRDGSRIRLKAKHGVWLFLAFVFFSSIAEARSGVGGPIWVLATLWKWTPLLAEGFMLNLVMSFLAMAIGTVNGTLLGIAQVSLMPPVKHTSWFVTQFFRNSPWLVLMFYVMYLVPFQFTIGSVIIPFPDWLKATLGFSLPVMANVSELVRGGIQSIPSGQKEAAESLAFTRRQVFWMIIIPQCVKRILPTWMNLYAILTQATVLASIVGVIEVVTTAHEILGAEYEPSLLLPLYTYVLLWFFAYCYPIARWTLHLERKFAVQM